MIIYLQFQLTLMSHYLFFCSRINHVLLCAAGAAEQDLFVQSIVLANNVCIKNRQLCFINVYIRFEQLSFIPSYWSKQ